MNCYKVEVKTTNAVGDNFYVKGKYLDCQDGQVFVLTDSPDEIFKQWGKVVESVTTDGIGYVMDEKESK